MRRWFAGPQMIWEYTYRIVDRQGILTELNHMGSRGWEAVFFREAERGEQEFNLVVYFKRAIG